MHAINSLVHGQGAISTLARMLSSILNGAIMGMVYGMISGIVGATIGGLGGAITNAQCQWEEEEGMHKILSVVDGL